MDNQVLYFSDNFFSAGVTDIYNQEKQRVGQLDLKSAFSSSVDILDENGEKIISGRFPFFGRSWIVTGKDDQEVGTLKARFSFFTKRYEYIAQNRGVYTIESEAFSRQYDIYDEEGKMAATFAKVNGFLASAAFQLDNQSERLTSEELIAVVMGVNAIQKRRRNAANGGAAN